MASYLSSRQTWEIVRAQRRSRLRASAGFSERNLEGSVVFADTAAQNEFYARRCAMFSAFAPFVAEGHSIADLLEEVEGTASAMRIAVLTAAHKG